MPESKTEEQQAPNAIRAPEPVVASTVPCPMCREPVDPKARLCRHCKSDLTWRRHISISSTTIAMITALIAVLGTVGPAAKRMFMPSDASISATLVGSDRNGVTMLLQNAGGKAGTVSRAHVRLPTNAGKIFSADFVAVPTAAFVDSEKNMLQYFQLEWGFLEEPKSGKPNSLECDYQISGLKSGMQFNYELKQQQCSDAILTFHLAVEEQDKQGNLKYFESKSKSP